MFFKFCINGRTQRKGKHHVFDRWMCREWKKPRGQTQIQGNREKTKAGYNLEHLQFQLTSINMKVYLSFWQNTFITYEKLFGDFEEKEKSNLFLKV